MGNRAHVIFANGDDISPAVYLHWNGGPESVYPMLDELRVRMGDRLGDSSYSAARFCGVVADFFGDSGGLSLGVVNGPNALTPRALQDYNHGDNGVYVVEPEHVRRFVTDHGATSWDDPPRELSLADVKAEEARAREPLENYVPAIAEHFAAVRAARANLADA